MVGIIYIHTRLGIETETESEPPYPRVSTIGSNTFSFLGSWCGDQLPLDFKTLIET